MAGAASYFVLGANSPADLPPVALAAAGLATGALGLAALGAAGVLAMDAATASPAYAGSEVGWLAPVLGLGVVTAGIAYWTGIAASRRLGSRLASFVALLEVVAGVAFAWLLLDQLPGPLQLAGGVLIVAGVIVVKLGERPRASRRRPRVVAATQVLPERS